MSEQPHYSEGICGDGAAILKDGQMMPIEDIVAELNAHAAPSPAPEPGQVEALLASIAELPTGAGEMVTFEGCDYICVTPEDLDAVHDAALRAADQHDGLRAELADVTRREGKLRDEVDRLRFSREAARQELEHAVRELRFTAYNECKPVRDKDFKAGIEYALDELAAILEQ